MEALEGAFHTALRAGVRVAIGLVFLLVTACGGPATSVETDGAGGSGDKGAGDSADAQPGTRASSPGASRAVVRITPGDGAEGVAPSGALRVTAERGRLRKVRVEDSAGRAVDGGIAPGGRTWEPTGRLALGTRYTVDAVAVDRAGRRAAGHASFTTLAPRDRFTAFFTPEDGSTVGTGMPVSLTFDRAVADRAAVERAVRVTAEPPVEVAAHWFGDRRLDFRPEEYWAAGTRVTLSLRLKDVEGAPGVYGTQSKDVSFTVGRSQVSVVDASAKTMRVTRSGMLLRILPISAGAPETPTYNGKMVITEKFEVTRMNGDTVGFGGEYDIPDVPHAMRLTTSGTFVHGNYWSPKDTFGRVNTSHGCIGLADVKGPEPGDGPVDRTTAGAWFFDHSLVGDVIEVVNSHDTTVAPDNGLNGWNMDWPTWRRGSALR